MKKSFLITIFIILPLLAFSQTDITPADISFQIDKLWVLIAAALVFFMQAGFLALELGLVMGKDASSIGLKNGIDLPGVRTLGVGERLLQR